MKNFLILTFSVLVLMSCKKDPDYYLSTIEGKTWVNQESKPFNTGPQTFDNPFSNTSGATLDDIYWDITKFTLTSSDEEYSGYGSGKIYVTKTRGSEKFEEVIEVPFWKWNEGPSKAGQFNEYDAEGEVLLGSNSTYLFQVIEVSKKKMELVVHFWDNQADYGGISNHYYSEVLNFEVE